MKLFSIRPIMKCLLLTFLIGLVTHESKAQYFSGEITFQTRISAYNNTVNLDSLRTEKESTINKYLITSKYYKSSYFKNGEYTYSYTYHNETKRMYDDYAERPYITYRDSRKSSSSYLGSEILKDSTDNILGYDCTMITTSDNTGSYTSCYSDAISVNPSDFKGHKIGNWYERLKDLNGGIGIKSFTEYDDYVEIREAIEIREYDVKLSEFELPKKPIAASYSALDKSVEIKQPTQDQIRCYQFHVRSASKPTGKPVTSTVSFLVMKNGEMKFPEALEEDEQNLYKVVLEIIKECELSFTPGEIDGKKVDSEGYFTAEFQI